jgi:hypothetical protein
VIESLIVLAVAWGLWWLTQAVAQVRYERRWPPPPVTQTAPLPPTPPPYLAVDLARARAARRGHRGEAR